MIVYVYDSKTNQKKETIKNVTAVSSVGAKFLVCVENEMRGIPKENIKLVVYGFEKGLK